MDYKQKYLKYKQKYITLKNQKGGDLKTDFFLKYPFEKEYVDGNNIKIKFMDNDYIVNFKDIEINIYKDGQLILNLLKAEKIFVVLDFNNASELLKNILEMFNMEYCQFFDKIFDNDDLYNDTKMNSFLLLNNKHKNYPMLKFFYKIGSIKEKIENKFYLTIKENKFEILNDDEEDNIIIKNEEEILLKFKVFERCTYFLDIVEYNNCKNLVDEILNLYNLSFAISKSILCDECIEFNNQYVYLNKRHELNGSFQRILSEEYNSNLGICNDLLTEKLYSINFIWLRVDSFTESCFSIMGGSDIFVDINTIDNILKLQENEFFIKLINFSKNNPNALVNFWIDAEQVRIETLINLRLVFDILNRNLGLKLCIRNVWSLKITNEMNKKYPDILPKCSGFSLILKVDLYKCIICVEELERHTYSVFADLDMKPIGEDIILSENNIRILNRIGLVLTGIGIIFENGFQIMGSTIPKIKKGVIETFNIMMIERTMMLLKIFKDFYTDFNNSRWSLYTEQLVYRLYNPMYKYLYYKCDLGLYYINNKKIDKDTDIKEIFCYLSECSQQWVKEPTFENDDILEKFGTFVSYELFNLFSVEEVNCFFDNILTNNDIFKIINFYSIPETLQKYLNELKIKSTMFDVNTLTRNPVKKDDLVIFDDPTTIPASTQVWPFKMCKKYTKVKTSQ